MKRVKDRSLCIMSKALNTWRTTANKYKDKDFSTFIKKRWPSIREEVWEEFVAYNSDYCFGRLSAWGKYMRTKITMNLRLGSRGYSFAHKLWAKEDEDALLAGKAAPLSYLQPGHGKDFVRAHVHIHPASGEPIIKNRALEEVHDRLVCS